MLKKIVSIALLLCSLPLAAQQVLNGARGVPVPNASSTGTTRYSLVKLTGTPNSQAVITSTTDTLGIAGICDSNCGTTGSAYVMNSGFELCNFDGATIAGDWVQNSPSIGGDCNDAGSSPGSTTFARVLSTNGAAGQYLVLLGQSPAGGGSGGFTPGLDITGTNGSWKVVGFNGKALNQTNVPSTNGQVWGWSVSAQQYQLGTIAGLLGYSPAGTGNCSSGQYAIGLTTGAPSCAQVAYGQLSGTPSLGSIAVLNGSGNGSLGVTTNGITGSAGETLCTDGSGNATTVGCAGGGGGSVTSVGPAPGTALGGLGTFGFNNQTTTPQLSFSLNSFPAHTFYGNNTGTTGAGSIVSPACADLSNAAASCSTDTTNASNIGSGTLNTARMPAVLSVATGFQIAGAAANRHFLIGNGTNYVDGVLQSGDVPNNGANTTGNAGTATALAATPSQCSGGQFALGIAASGNANCGTPAGGGNMSSSGSWTVGDLAVANNVGGTAFVDGGPIPTSLPPNGSAGGDLNGTYPNPGVAQINGAAVPTSAALVGTNGSKQLIPQTGTIANNTTGNAGTATALAATPSQCSGSQFATGVAANGNANCATPAGGGNMSSSGSFTVGHVFVANNTSGTAAIDGGAIPTTLPPNGSAGGDLSGSYPNPGVAQVNGAAVPASAALVGTNSSKQLIAQTGTIANNTTGNAGTATALAATPSQCTGSQVAQGITASGNANCVTPSGSGNMTGTNNSTTFDVIAANNTGSTLTSAIDMPANPMANSTNSAVANATLVQAQSVGSGQTGTSPTGGMTVLKGGDNGKNPISGDVANTGGDTIVAAGAADLSSSTPAQNYVPGDLRQMSSWRLGTTVSYAGLTYSGRLFCDLGSDAGGGNGHNVANICPTPASMQHPIGVFWYSANAPFLNPNGNSIWIQREGNTTGAQTFANEEWSAGQQICADTNNSDTNGYYGFFTYNCNPPNVPVGVARLAETLAGKTHAIEMFLTPGSTGMAWQVVPKSSSNYTVQASDFSTPSTGGNWFIIGSPTSTLTFTLPSTVPTSPGCVMFTNKNSSGGLIINPNGVAVNGTTVNRTLSVNQSEMICVYANSSSPATGSGVEYEAFGQDSTNSTGASYSWNMTAKTANYTITASDFAQSPPTWFYAGSPTTSITWTLPGSGSLPSANGCVRISSLTSTLATTINPNSVALNGSTSNVTMGNSDTVEICYDSTSSNYKSHGITSNLAMPNGVTGTTQTSSDNSTLLATDAFVQSVVSGTAGWTVQFPTAQSVSLGTTTGVINTTTMLTPGSAGTYQFSAQIIQTAAGTGGTCSTQGSLSLQLNWTDADTSTAITGQNNVPAISSTGAVLSGTFAANASPGAAQIYTGVARNIRVKASTAISYTANTQVASNCTTPPVFEIRPVLLGPTGW